MQVGVCIASAEDKMVVSTGCNSMPHLDGIDSDSKEKGGYSWDEDSDMGKVHVAYCLLLSTNLVHTIVYNI